MFKLTSENKKILGATLISIIIVAPISYYLGTTKDSLSPVEFNKLNQECIKFGIETWGKQYDYRDNTVTTRRYEFSLPLESCVMHMKLVTGSREDNNFFETETLKDLYLDREIIFFSTNCFEAQYCSTRGQVAEKALEIFKR